MKINLNLTSLDYKTQNPIIFGSVVNSWDRKLKMLDASFYTFFSAAEKEGFNMDIKKSRRIKEETISIINKFDLDQLRFSQVKNEGVDFQSSLQGWKKILNEKIN